MASRWTDGQTGSQLSSRTRTGGVPVASYCHVEPAASGHALGMHSRMVANILHKAALSNPQTGRLRQHCTEHMRIVERSIQRRHAAECRAPKCNLGRVRCELRGAEGNNTQPACVQHTGKQHVALGLRMLM
eukprot:366119-Chlamydomonas_euryale.AAC.13